MAQSDDEIPDLFPAPRRPGQAAARSAVSQPAGRSGHERRVSARPVVPSGTPSVLSTEPPPLRIADTPSSDGLEIDYEDRSPAENRGTVVVGTPEDALEFDPSSIRRPTVEEYLRGRPSAPLTSAQSPEIAEVGELELDTPPFELEPASSIPPPPSPSMAPPGFAVPSLGRSASIARPASMASPVPVAPSAPTARPASIAPPASVAPPASIAVRASQYPSTSVAPPATNTAYASQYPPGSAASSVSHYPPAPAVPQSLGMNFPGFSGESELGDGLDDLGFGGASLAQLNVAIPMPDADDVPWPLARTPYPDEIDIAKDDVVELSGFGPPPEGFLLAPVYFLRVFFARNKITELCRNAERQLEAAERARDEKLARIAEHERPGLQNNDRFRSLFSTIDRHDQNIVSRRQALNAADVDGVEELRRVQLELEALGRERSLKESNKNDQARVVEQHQRELDRARAVLRRTEIELRNLEERRTQGVNFGVVDYETRKNAQLTEKERAQLFIENALSSRQLIERKLEQAQDELRRVVADFQGHEAQKEALLMAHEGDLAERSRELDQAIRGRLKDLAHAARVIFELRGEVKVHPHTRLEIAATDDVVRTAFIEHTRAQAALASMDVEMYRLGRLMWIGFSLLILTALLGSAFL